MGNEKTKNAILDAAREEFLDNGFEKASLRKIAKKADLTTGAIYSYFSDKNKLYEGVVGEVAESFYDNYVRVQSEFEKIDDMQKKDEMPDYTKAAMKEMIAFIYDNYDIFKLLVCKSEGTSYDNFVHRLIEVEEVQTIKFIDKMRDMNCLKYYPSKQLVHILCGGLVTGIFDVVVHDIPVDQAYNYLEKMRQYHTAGWYDILFK